jgi:putative ABC transport system substrate-binding protein
LVRGGVRRVGVLMDRVATDTTPQSYLVAFTQGLRQLGWTEGQNLRIDVRWSAGDVELARIYAAQLIGLMPDVILASTTNRRSGWATRPWQLIWARFTNAGFLA